MSTSSRPRLADFKDLQEIGRGGFGIVYAATQLNGGRVALKKICSRAAGERIKSEIRAIRSLRHPNIVQFYEDFIEDGSTYVVMELCELGSIRTYVKKNGPLNDRAAAYVLRQIISAVKYMHREGVLHRDLSCGNILISRIFSPDKISVKLCDFGLATHLRKGETACTVVGTPGYIAPQVFKQEYDQAADVFSLGGVLYTLLTASDPPSKGPIVFNGLGISAVELIESMMEPDVMKRISLNDIQHSNFMIDHCDNPSISREWSAMGDRSGLPGRSRERQNSREYTRERRSENVLLLENGRNNEQRPRRAISNPPKIRCSSYFAAGGAFMDSGFGSKSSGERKGTSKSSNPTLHNVNNLNTRDNNLPVWPLPIYRCGGTRMVTAAGRYIILDDNLLIFEVANKSGLITKIVTVTIDIRGKQQVIFDKPLHMDVKQPKEHDSLVVPAEGYDSKPFTSYSAMNRYERDLYAQMANAVEAMRGRVDKVVYQRPPQFPSAVAKIMENSSFRIVFRDQRRLVQKSGSRDVQIHFPGGNKEDVLDPDTLSKFDEVRKFLRKVENIWEEQIGRFPLLFAISRESVTSPQTPVLENRAPFSVKNQTQSILTQRSAPATFDPYIKRSSDCSKRFCDGLRFKMNKNNEVCSVESSDGRYLRVSSMSKSKFIYRSNPGSSEQRMAVGNFGVKFLLLYWKFQVKDVWVCQSAWFHVNDDIYPDGARELFDCLQNEIKRREVQG
ncbi:kinase domain protein [Dictyocaulus viviparus]|uniref:Kinase domain protein n=1 Tax=Dictyocaulus viviparus TaxID=29172 RepID=A0A0D8XFY7_DICVI|nr:kinase domain protein [Dictyocaulus viviparus]